MKNLIFCFCVFFGFQIQAKELDSIYLNKQKLYYHTSKSNQESKRLFIFLHTNLEAFQGKTENNAVPMDSLVEKNQALIQIFKSNGIDLLVPQAYNEYSWLKEKGEEFISTLIETHKNRYESIMIGGFSEGGTAAYRIFYKNPEKFSALILFNAYPQQDYFNKNVDYTEVTNKKIFFVSQKNDKLLPYEFLLMEYRRQKLVNSESYFYLQDGKHEFNYELSFFNELIQKLNYSNKSNISNEGFIWVYPPIDGLVFDHEIINLVDFRKSYSERYNIDIKEYKSQVESKKTLEGIIKKNRFVKVVPILFSLEELAKKELIEFSFVSNNTTYTIYFDNYLLMEKW
jgi:hypothetical protein